MILGVGPGFGYAIGGNRPGYSREAGERTSLVRLDGRGHLSGQIGKTV